MEDGWIALGEEPSELRHGCRKHMAFWGQRQNPHQALTQSYACGSENGEQRWVGRRCGTRALVRR